MRPAVIVSLLLGSGLACFSVSEAFAAATLAGCPMFPADNIWNAPIDMLPVDANSTAYVNTIGAGSHLHPDFGSGLIDGAPFGIPYAVVPGSQPKVAISFDYSDESDPGPYPIPPTAPIEGGAQSDGDRHVLIVDNDNCLLYETWATYPNADGTWHAGSGALFDLKADALRPAGWTSADAAGLPILPGLVRYDEVAAGAIEHALRFTAPQTRNIYVWPARHEASNRPGAQYPPMGQRFRLKADYDLSNFSAANRVILTALKKYGMILADNGSSWFISGTQDERWNNDLLDELKSIPGSAFEAVDVSALMLNADSAAVRGGTSTTPTVIEFYHTELHHYFITASDAEAQSIDHGAAGSGWQRTGGTFKAGGTNSVCRFYGTQTPGPNGKPLGPNSHFYTASAAECTQVKNDPGWTYEGIAFNVDPAPGPQCPSNRVPVYRAYNNRYTENDSNHRITADYQAYQSMIALGWRGEGVVMCAQR